MKRRQKERYQPQPCKIRHDTNHISSSSLIMREMRTLIPSPASVHAMKNPATFSSFLWKVEIGEYG